MADLVLKTLYAPQKDSPGTYITGDLGAADTFVTVANADIWSSLTLPFPLTLGYDKKLTERVLVTAINNNQLTIVRGSGAINWLANTVIARAFNAQDLGDLQDNQATIAAQVNAHDGTIILNAEAAAQNLASAVTALEAADDALDAAMVKESNLPTAVEDILGITTPTPGQASKLQYRFTDTTTGTTSTKQVDIPVGSPSGQGLITAVMWQKILDLENAVLALQQQGGRFIGVSFDTKADLDAYVIPSTVNQGDFTFVADDETHSDATCRYIYDGSAFQFGYVINYDPVGIATATTPGLVLASTSATADGSINVDSNGAMTLNGFSHFFIDSL